VTGKQVLRAGVAAAVLAVLAGALPSPASAASYTVQSCREADGTPLSARAWIPAGNAGSRSDTCLAGGSLSVALGTDPDDTAPGAISGYRFDLPVGITISSYTAWIAAETGALPSSQARYVAGLGQGDELAIPTVLDGCYTNAPTCSEGTFSDPLDPNNRVTLEVLLGGLGFMAACASSTDACVPDVADPPARAALFRIAIELDDSLVPDVGAVRGTIADGAPISGIRSVVADVNDDGSGVLRTELLVDDVVVEQQDGTGTCKPPFTVADPCPRSDRATFVLDTAALPEGPHTVAVRAYDAAMNVAESAPLGFDVDHPAPPPPVVITPPPVVITPPPAPTPEPAAVRLDAPKRVRLPSSERVMGTVAGRDGARRAGVPVRFEKRPFGADEDDWRSMRSTAVTDARGRFRVPVPRESAQVRASVSSEAFSATPAIVRFVRPLRARIKASDRRLRNGQRLTLRGRLRNAGGAGDERTVLIQSRIRGTWRSVDSVETGRRGRIVWRYRFTNTRQTARYRFRFVVPREKGLPWKKLVTKQVSVVVRAA
jgi:hypothetical protein